MEKERDTGRQTTPTGSALRYSAFCRRSPYCQSQAARGGHYQRLSVLLSGSQADRSIAAQCLQARLGCKFTQRAELGASEAPAHPRPTGGLVFCQLTIFVNSERLLVLRPGRREGFDSYQRCCSQALRQAGAPDTEGYVAEHRSHGTVHLGNTASYSQKHKADAPMAAHQ